MLQSWLRQKSSIEIILGEAGFSQEQIRYIKDNLETSQSPYDIFEFCELAKSFCKDYPEEGPAKVMEEMKAILKSYGCSAKLSVGDLRHVLTVYRDLRYEGMSSIEAWTAMDMLRKASDGYYSDTVELVASGSLSIEGAMGFMKIPYSMRPAPGVIFGLMKSGFSMGQAVKIDRMMSVYHPIDYDNPTRGPSCCPSWGGAIPPDWVLHMNVGALEEYLQMNGIEPAEAFGLLFNSQVSDMPETSKEFVELLKGLSEKNGIEHFGRYSLKILNAVKYPVGGRKNTVVIFPDADHNGAFYSDVKRLEELVDQGHMLSLFEIATDSQLVDRVDEVGRMIPIDLLVIAGHGFPLGIQLHSAQLGPASFEKGDDVEALRIGSVLNKDAQIVLISCSTAKETWFAWTPFAEWLQEKTGAEVFANTQNGNLRDWEFRTDGGVASCDFRGEGFSSSGTVLK